MMLFFFENKENLILLGPPIPPPQKRPRDTNGRDMASYSDYKVIPSLKIII